jgi:hypothetical protein
VKFLPQAQLGAKIAQIVLAVHFAELNDKKLPEEKFVNGLYRRPPEKGGAKTTDAGCGGQWPTNFLIRRASDCELVVVLGSFPFPLSARNVQRWYF